MESITFISLLLFLQVLTVVFSIYHLYTLYLYFKVTGSAKPWKAFVPFASMHEWLKKANMSMGWLISFIVCYIFVMFLVIVLLIVVPYINTTNYGIFLLFIAIYFIIVIVILVASIGFYIAMYRVIKKYNNKEQATIYILLLIFASIAIPFYIHFSLVPNVRIDNDEFSGHIGY